MTVRRVNLTLPVRRMLSAIVNQDDNNLPLLSSLGFKPTTSSTTVKPQLTSLLLKSGDNGKVVSSVCISKHFTLPAIFDGQRPLVETNGPQGGRHNE